MRASMTPTLPTTPPTPTRRRRDVASRRVVPTDRPREIMTDPNYTSRPHPSASPDPPNHTKKPHHRTRVHHTPIDTKIRSRSETPHTKPQNIRYDPPSLRYRYTFGHSDDRRPRSIASIDRSTATHLDGSSERRRRRRRCLPTRAPLPARRCPPRRSTVAARASRRARARARTGSRDPTSRPTWMGPCRGASFMCLVVWVNSVSRVVSGDTASARDSDRFDDRRRGGWRGDDDDETDARAMVVVVCSSRSSRKSRESWTRRW